MEARRTDPLVGLLVLLVHQLAGEALVRALDLPVPGPVVGLLLLLVTLTVRGRPAAVDAAADGLLRHLALLFVPAGTGVVQYAALLRAEAVPVAAALVLSTATGLVGTALVLRLLLRQPA